MNKFKKYNLKSFSIWTIEKIVIEKVNKIKEENKYKENLNNTNDWTTILGYLGEEIYKIIKWDKVSFKKEEDWSCYDFSVGWLYFDIKTVWIKSWKDIRDIIWKKYETYLQEFQVLEAKKYCDKHNIDYWKFWYIVLYYNQENNYVIVWFNNNLILKNILQRESVRRNPPFTDWSNFLIKNYIIPMVSDIETENIILDEENV